MKQLPPKKAFQWFAVFLLSMLFAVKQTNAQDNLAASQNIASILLPGSSKNMEATIATADFVFIGIISKLGNPVAAAPGQLTYHNVEIQITDQLKGKTASPAYVRLHVKTVRNVEMAPRLGESYIFLVEKSQPDLRVLKMLAVSKDSVDKITKALDQNFDRTFDEG